MEKTVDIDQIRCSIEEARSKGQLAHFPSLFLNVPSWSQFIQHLDYEFNTPPAVSESDEWHTVYNGVVTKPGFYFHARDVVRGGEFTFFPEAKDIHDTFNKVYNEYQNQGATFVNIVGNGMKVPLHEDDIDSVFWQCQGNTTWKIFETKDSIDPIQTIVVSPGDVVVVPVGVLHQLNPDVARAAIAFRYNEKRKA
jgi:mannose-6-phosphate isomerase-like protein (cupin superfamily)